MTKNKLTIEEWQVIGRKAKEINKALIDLQTLLANKLPKSKFLDKWMRANKSFGNLRSHLDDVVCGGFKELPDRVVTSVFYGTEGDRK